MSKLVVVPQEDLDAVEKARQELYALAERKGWVEDIMFSNITQSLWKVGNKRYPDLKEN